MKKRSLWILFLSALLCLSMLFSACDSGSTNDTEEPSGSDGEETTDTESGSGNEAIADEIPVDEKIDYLNILTEWNKYITSVGTYDAPTYSSNSTSLFSTYTETDGATVTQNTYGKIAVVVKEYNTDLRNPEDQVLHEDIPNRETSFINLETGLKLSVGELVYTSYDFAEGRYINQYSASVRLDTIVEIETKTWINTAAEGEPEMWGQVSTFAYYYNDGRVIKDKLTDRAEAITTGGVNALVIEGKAYHCRGGEVILETAADNVYALPNYTSAEYAGYTYFFSGSTVKVADSEYNIIVDCVLPAYIENNQATRTILSNGNIHYYATEGCSDNVNDYDYEDSGAKYKIWNVIINVYTGEMTRVELPYIFEDGIKTNFNTDTTGFKLEGEYQCATVRMIEDGKLSDTTETIILNNKLETIVKLPKLLKNQTGFATALGDGRFLVEVENLGGAAYYVGDSADGSVTRFFNNTSMLNGGFIRDGKVYNNELEMVFDMADVKEGWNIRSGRLFFKAVESFEDTSDPDNITTVSKEISYIGYIDESGSFQKNKLGEDVTVAVFGNNPELMLYKVTGSQDGTSFIKLYDINGNCLYQRSNSDVLVGVSISYGGKFGNSVLLIETVTGTSPRTNYYIIK